jgi:hypothetical protein
VSDLNWGRIEGDVARQDAARAELRSWMKAAFGVDLERVKLTRRGLVVRER